MLIAPPCSYFPRGSVLQVADRPGAVDKDRVIGAMALAFGSGAPGSDILGNEMQRPV